MQHVMSLHAKPHTEQDAHMFSCNLHFGQNDRDLLCATAVTWEMEQIQIPKQEHSMLTLEMKILPLLLLGLEPMTFQFIRIFPPLLIKVDL